MSWDDAKRDASRWLSGLQLKRPAAGERWDLRPFWPTLKFEGRYREMVINAIRRKLKARKIDAIFPDE